MNHLIVTLRNLTLSQPGQAPSGPLNIDIHKGEHWALVGTSGSGKTALLEAIAGRLAIRNGEIAYPFYEAYKQEHGISDPLFHPSRLIAYVGSRHQFRNLSNTTEFYYQQRYHASDSDQAPTVADYLSAIPTPTEAPIWTYQEVITRLHLEQLQEKELIKLSTGETKRLLLAAALIRNPVVLLLDNPLAGLDVQTRKEMNSLFAHMAATGITLILATAPTELPDIITHVAILKGGGIDAVLPRASFNPEVHVPVRRRTLDLAELEELLAIDPPPPHELIIGMKDITIRYGAQAILQDINWEVRQGERWALVGSNGAGKSTLLSLINADNPQAFARHLILFDRKKGSGESIWEIKRKIGFMSSELFQYFPMHNTCVQVIESGFYETSGLYRPSHAALAALSRRWMRLLGIEADADRLFSQVSLSVQRLCLLARALVKNPALLLLDEPCQGMDAAQQQYFRELVNTICTHSPVTLVYVSHYEHEIPEVCTHRLVLERGRVVELI